MISIQALAHRESVRGAGTVDACTRVQLKMLFAMFSQSLQMPFSKVQSYGPAGARVVPAVVVVEGTISSGFALAGMRMHGLSNMRRSSIAASPLYESPEHGEHSSAIDRRGTLHLPITPSMRNR